MNALSENFDLIFGKKVISATKTCEICLVKSENVLKVRCVQDMFLKI